MKKFYIVATIIGAIVPLYFFINHFAEQGFGLPLFLQLAFANKVSTGLVADLLLSSLVFWAIIGRDAARLGIGKISLLILGNCLIGLSFALPYYLYLREARAEERDGIAMGGRIKSVSH